MNSAKYIDVSFSRTAGYPPMGAKEISKTVPVSQYNIVHAMRNMSADQISLAAVSFIHLAILFFLLFGFTKQQEMPLLSFTVTMMDLSSSPNIVSNAASAPNNTSQPVEEEVVEASISEMNLPEKKKIVKKTPTPENAPKTKAPVSMSSQQQTAVLSSDAPAKFDAAYLKNDAPTYPALSRRLGEKGDILLNVYVNVNGNAEKIDVKKSSGFSRLDNAALSTVKNWRFVSAKKGGQLVASWVQVPVNFVLE